MFSVSLFSHHPFPSISLPFLSSINKKDGGFCIAFAKKEYICRKKTKLTQQRDFAF